MQYPSGFLLDHHKLDRRGKRTISNVDFFEPSDPGFVAMMRNLSVRSAWDPRAVHVRWYASGALNLKHEPVQQTLVVPLDSQSQQYRTVDRIFSRWLGDTTIVLAKVVGIEPMARWSPRAVA